MIHGRVCVSCQQNGCTIDLYGPMRVPQTRINNKNQELLFQEFQDQRKVPSFNIAAVEIVKIIATRCTKSRCHLFIKPAALLALNTAARSMTAASIESDENLGEIYVCVYLYNALLFCKLDS